MKAQRPRDRVPDQGSVLWNAVPWWLLLVTGVVSGAIASGLFWWSQFDQSRRGPGFLFGIGAIFTFIALGCLLLLVWHVGIHLRRRRRPDT